MTTTTNNSRIVQGAVAGGLSTMLVATLFVFTPFTLYVGNLDEFTVPFGTIAGHYLPFALVLAGVAGLVGMLLPAGMYARFAALLAVVGILAWLQGNVLVWDYGLLDGRSIDWTIEPWRGWLDLSLWVVGVAGALFAARAMGRRIIYLAIAIFCMQLALFGYSWLAHQQQLAEKENNPLAAAGRKSCTGSPRRRISSISLPTASSPTYSRRLSTRVPRVRVTPRCWTDSCSSRNTWGYFRIPT